jgi:hypothetical protein
MTPLASLIDSLERLCEPTRSHGWCDPSKDGEGGASIQTHASSHAQIGELTAACAHAYAPARRSRHHVAMYGAVAPAGGAKLERRGLSCPRVESAPPPPREVFERFFFDMPSASAAGAPLSTSGVCRMGEGIPEVLSARLRRSNAETFQIDTNEILTTASANRRLNGILESLSEPPDGKLAPLLSSGDCSKLAPPAPGSGSLGQSP